MIQSLKLKNYRSYSDFYLDFSPHTTFITGPNGRGKTNILEAVLVLTQGKSYRAKDQYLIKNNQSETKIEGIFNDHSRSVKLYKINDKHEKEFFVKNKKYTRLLYNQKIPVVLFEPEFFQLITRGPDVRRDYLDNLVGSINPLYTTQLNKYKRSLAQRNNLLKYNSTSDQLFVWDVKLSQLAGYIIQERIKIIKEITNTISEIYSSIADKKCTVEMKYISKISLENYTENLLKKLQKTINIDSEKGFTSHGPHRDDIEFILNNNEITISASRGETRTILLSLKIIEARIVENVTDKKPIILLDDVFSELDSARQKKLLLYIKNNQTVITSTELYNIFKSFNKKIINLEDKQN